LYRPGGHATKAEDIENYFDWLDTQFGRRQLEAGHGRLFPTHPEWVQNSNEHWDPQQYQTASLQGLLVSAGGNPILTPDDWKAKRQDILMRVAWGLGAAPPRAEGLAETYGAEPATVAAMVNRAQVPAGIAKRSITFGNYVAGDLYFPAGGEISGHRLPVVIWLHPISTANGYIAGYRRGEPFQFTLARAGFAVFAFDQIGNGQRIEEVRKFYDRYPHWSLMGRTVQDVRAAVDVLRRTEFLDPQRILVAGYATGGMAALYAAALDDRIAGVISVAGFTPMRLDTADKGTGGIARWSHWLPLLPRLGAFIGQETRIPYDFHEIIAAIAPRPAVIMTPQVDYQSTAADILVCLNEARKVYELLKADQTLALFVANDYNRFSPELQEQVLDQLKRMVPLTGQ
jgi:pimeloyl-ACP methyl ester carboxylesterase